MNRSILMQITWDVLEAAQDAGDDEVIHACRKLIIANRLGKIRGHFKAEKRIVLAFAECIRVA